MGKRHPSQWSGIDWLDQAGALALAGQIKEFWAARGHIVSAWLEPLHSTDADGRERVFCYCIRSDMVGGLPATMRRAA